MIDLDDTKFREHLRLASAVTDIMSVPAGTSRVRIRVRQGRIPAVVCIAFMNNTFACNRVTMIPWTTIVWYRVASLALNSAPISMRVAEVALVRSMDWFVDASVNTVLAKVVIILQEVRGAFMTPSLGVFYSSSFQTKLALPLIEKHLPTYVAHEGGSHFSGPLDSNNVP